MPLLLVIDWASSLLLQIVCCPGNTHLEKIKFSFASAHQQHTVLRGTGWICTSTSHSSSKTSSGGNCFCLCEFIFCINPIDLENLNFMVYSIPCALTFFLPPLLLRFLSSDRMYLMKISIPI